MAEGETGVRDLIAELPRFQRPSAAFLHAIAPGIKRRNGPTLKFPAGNRADTLSDTALNALDHVRFAPSADGLMSERGLDDQAVMVFLLNNMTLGLAKHLNDIPPQMELMVVAARPATSQQVNDETKIYRKNRFRYIKWAAGMALANNPDISASAEIPSELLPPDANRPGPGSLTLTLRKNNFESMKRTGEVPPGWSVEHIEARGLNTGSPDKNRLGNLIIMPTAINAWTNKLDSWQSVIHFPLNQEAARSEFMLSARPKQAPEHGFFLYGVAKPVNVSTHALKKWQDRSIDDLPLNLEPVQHGQGYYFHNKANNQSSACRL